MEELTPAMGQTDPPAFFAYFSLPIMEVIQHEDFLNFI